jgi:6-phosphogluconolactonase (cycloisomerase 2 family)
MLDFVSLTASGGMNPRHFSLNEDGSKIAVAHQESKTVVIWSRDCESGAIEKQIAVASNLGPGGLT